MRAIFIKIEIRRSSESILRKNSNWNQKEERLIAIRKAGLLY
jgi:hypothetical protein